MQAELASAPPRRWWGALAEYALVVVIGMGALVLVLDLPHRDLDVPLCYGGDSCFYLLIAKGVVDTGSPYHFPQVGAPFALDLHDFANFPPVHVVLLKILSLGISSPAGLLNAYFLLGFPLTIVTTLAVLRHFRCAYGPALVCSLLFAFSPYAFFRGQSPLACYFLVPPSIMVVLWVYRGEPLFFVPDSSGKSRLRLWHGKTWLAAGVLLAMGLSDVYYSFFTCFMLVLAGLASAWQARAFKPLLASWLLIGVVVAGSVLCLIPAVGYALENGSNPDAMNRSMIDSEHFGMRIAQLLMPVSGHRVPLLAMVKQRFNVKLIFLSENEHSSLGLLASVGFLILIFRLLAPADRDEKSLWVPLSRLNLFAVLLATIGGFGLLVAAALPQIRSYNRISLFIGFLSLFGLALVLQKWQERWSATVARRWLGWAVLGFLLIVGILDQTPANMFAVPAAWASDAAFVEKLQAELPAQAMVYQLPYRVFPEGARYDHLRLYLHSTDLHWSYPVMRSRPGDFWHKELAAKPLDEMLPQLAWAGFQGICIDRSGDLTDADLEKKLAERLRVAPIVSPDKQFAFYPLQEFSLALKAKVAPEEWQRLHDQTVHPVVISWLRGFMRTPEMRPKDGRWCSATGTAQLCNLGESPQTIRLSLSVRSGFASPATLKIDGPLLRCQATIDSEQGEIEAVIEVPPGRHMVSFSCDAPAFENNARHVFRVIDFQIRSQESGVRNRESGIRSRS